ncbi:MAG: hypothetical protein M3Q32_06315 [Pseudomonadota bacterium]|nr:hypothetical protein [Burkholderiales bacterium]MDQ3195979.1 hypothetical protein [Pseudomonadota bacterium]
MATNDERGLAGARSSAMAKETKDEPEALAADIGHQEEEPHPHDDDLPYHLRSESYGGGEVHARHGKVNAWLGVVYLVLLVWALYYGYIYWGGLGPGLDY